ncbi:MAG: 2TM domain-containing protein [Bacillota bacterium]
MKPEERKGLTVHAIVTLCVVALLITINLTLCPGFLWFFFPLAGMSIGLAIHFFGVRKAR